MTFKLKYFFYPVIIVVLVFGFAACKKSNMQKTDVTGKPFVKFTVTEKAPKGDLYLITPNTSFIDSNFYFKNLSDSTSLITYKWDFGDGTISTLKSPIHKYAKRGQYKVTLLVNNNNITSDTSSVELSVILGQKILSNGETRNITPINALETPDKGFLILCQNVAAGFTTYTYSLIKTDSLFNQQTVYNFPANYSFFSFQALSDGNYILTGNSNNNPANSNQLFKMSPTGSIIWTKSFLNTSFLERVEQVDNSSLLLTAENFILDNSGNTQVRTNIIKTDISGNQIWSNLFNTNTIIQYSNELILQSDGFIFSGNRPSPLGTQAHLDSLIIVKMDYNGNVLWKNTTLWQLGQFYSPGDTHIAMTPNGNYNVITNVVNLGLYFLSPTGAFLNLTQLDKTPLLNNSSSDGNILMLETNYSSGIQGRVEKLDQNGNLLWYKQFDDYLYDTGGKNIYEYEKDKYILIGSQEALNSDGFNHHSNALFLELNKSGLEL